MQPMRFPAWPFDGPVALTEHDPESGLIERHLFDQWRALSEEGLQPFDPDVYKLLKRTLSRSAHRFVPESD